MSPEENLENLLRIEARARLGAAAAANAMARYIAERTKNETLTRKSHGPGAYYKAKRGEPPSSASGSLANSMYWLPAAQGLRTSAYAGNEARHARVLEFGCVLRPTSGKHLGWKDTGGIWRHRSVTVTPHPYLSTTTDEAIRDGGLRQAAIEGFRPYDP